ncbi:MAG TPA: HAMP domain-containing sensor histidine kinase [Bacteroidales bacterium]|nr:HAMP domain-containing sensor histidine kinase [Bacteroidales bacterium]
MNIYEKKQRWKYVLLIIAFIIGGGSLWYTSKLVNTISEDERKKIELWAEATKMLVNNDLSSDAILFPLLVLENNTQIPVILTNDEGKIMTYNNLDSMKVKKKGYLEKMLVKMKNENDSIVIDLGDNNYQYLYYRNSNLLRKLAIFPYVQLGVIVLFISVSYFAFSISRKAEQNQVWTGLSKETAHQLGTPISSLSGWVELLKQSDASPDTIQELEKDSERLTKIADRFSKIGSKPTLVEMDIIGIIENSLTYLKTRRGKSVAFEKEFPSAPLIIKVNETLFDWVIENLCKNAMDAMEGSGTITIKCIKESGLTHIDVKDTGKGIPKAKFNTIFKPGYTTKKRGWGLGLSLSKRIIEVYHYGKLYVLESETGKGTTFRITFRA